MESSTNSDGAWIEAQKKPSRYASHNICWNDDSFQSLLDVSLPNYFFLFNCMIANIYDKNKKYIKYGIYIPMHGRVDVLVSCKRIPQRAK